MTGFRDTEFVRQLLDFCEEDLQLGLYRAVRPDIADKTENEVLAEIRKFTV